MQDPVQPFDWERIFIDQFPWLYLGEVAFRTLFMFIVLLTALTVSGKREVRQLSIYELVLLIGLGSAAGDPMFYDDVPLSAAVVVFIVMMGCYKLTIYISDRNQIVRETLEGKPVYVIEDGCILTSNFKREDLGQEDLFANLRLEGVYQLGQVRMAILESNGQLSIFQFERDAVQVGLSILPKALNQQVADIGVPGKYACCTCGHVQAFDGPATQPLCATCKQSGWIEATH